MNTQNTQASDENLPVPSDREVEEHAASMQSTPMMLLQQAIEKGMSIDVLDRLMALHERWEKNNAQREFAAAFAAAKAEMPVLEKNRLVGFDAKKEGGRRTAYKHADLAEIVGKVTPVLAKHGLWHRFKQTSEPNQPITVVCIIGHAAGHTIESEPLTAGRDDSQSSMNSLQRIGSTLTYLQRYSLMAALGLAAAGDDDDGAMVDVTPITAEQAADLAERMKLAGIKPERFKEKYHIETLAQLPQAQLQDALDSIAAFKAQKEARQ
jgi:hypothetical protein